MLYKWVIGFVVANLGLGVYLANQPKPEPRAEVEPLRLVGEEQLRLLHEVPAQVTAATTQAAPVQATPVELEETEELPDLAEAARQCRVWGPESDQRAFDDLRTDLASQGMLSSIQEATETVKTSYLVYATGFGTGQALRDGVAALKSRNIDHYVMRTEPPGAISVGLFSSAANAERTRQQVEQLGFQAEIEERLKQRSVYTLQAFVDPESKWFSASTSSCETIAQGR